VKPQDTSDFSAVPHLDEAKDYYTSAQKELTVKEQTAGLVCRISHSHGYLWVVVEN
jgi:hypothetical protein